jgi:subtilase family serine protease
LKKRFGSLVGCFGLLVATTALGSAAATTTAASVASVVTSQPFAQVVSRAYAQPPTTAQCEQALSLACYSPAQFEAAYDMAPLYNAGFAGQGKTIALVDSFGSPTIGSDLKAFDRAFHLPAPPSFTVIQPAGAVPPFDPNNATMVNWAFETSLDVEYAHAMAPDANLLLVETPVAETEGVAGFPQIVNAENYVINHHLADVISQSFGATEETFPTEASLLSLRSALINADLHHVTVLAASGDGGATDDRNAAGTLFYLHRVDSWPSTDPLVTSVGGTQLHLNASGARTEPDNVWNDTNILGSPAAGGGGTSEFFARPGYQRGVAAVVGATRGTPDIALSAAVDGAALVYLSAGLPAGFYLVGGTSEATPLFSGVAAIADQAAGYDLGLLNPKLYKLAAANAPGISDIALGSNTVTFVQGGTSHTVAGWAAVPGYDLASGLGTVDGAQLVAELATS